MKIVKMKSTMAKRFYDFYV